MSAARRKEIPAKIRNQVMDEFNWRCAFCGHHSPHIHHMNENHNDNRVANLIPLCPNCHLVDQHNPTRTIELGRLQLFRKHRDPFILAHQFQPIFSRMSFFNALEAMLLVNEDSEYAEQLMRENMDAIKAEGSVANSLISLVSNLNMGSYYADELGKLVGFLLQRDSPLRLSPERSPLHKHAAMVEAMRGMPSPNNTNEYRRHVIESRERAEELIVEMLRFQDWSPDYRFRKGGTPYG